MTGRYALRPRRLGVAVKPAEVVGAITSDDGAASVVGSENESDSGQSVASRRSYSDVVAARQPSPSIKVEEVSTTLGDLNNYLNKTFLRDPLSVLTELTSDEEENERPWIEVRSRRSKSLESPRKKGFKESKQGSTKKNVEFTAKEAVFAAAEDSLTPAEKDLIDRRARLVSVTLGDDSFTTAEAEPGEGVRLSGSSPVLGQEAVGVKADVDELIGTEADLPGRVCGDRAVAGSSKGKAVDPGNWGAVGLTSKEIDPVVQQEELDAYKYPEMVLQGLTPGELSEEAQRAELEHWNETANRAFVEDVPRASTPVGVSATRPDATSLKAEAEAASEQISILQDHIARLEQEKLLTSEAAADTAAHVHRVKIEVPPPPLSSTAAGVIRNRVVGRSVPSTSLPTRPASLVPIAQVAPRSYLGQALSKLPSLPPSVPAISGGVPGDDSSSSDSSSESSSSDDAEAVLAASKSKKAKHHKKKKRMLIKPIAPRDYDGSPDARAYHRFVTEGTAYVQDGNVKPKRMTFMLSYYLKGKAYDFYTQKVSMNYTEWSLQRFFEAMFNYCFPINYRMNQRDKLKRSYQNERTVSEYVHELDELYNMIGLVDERDKVIKLWYGLVPVIQRGLWRDGLNPEVSDWDLVRDHAEIIEISESVPDRSLRQKRADNPLPFGNTARRFGGGTPAKRFDNAVGSNSGRDARVRTDGRERPSDKPVPGGGSRPFVPRPSPGDGASGKPVRQNISFKTPMSEKDRTELTAAGKCFRCREVGHVSRNCPQGLNVRSNRTGRPPGISSAKVSIALAKAERIRDLGNTTQMLHGVQLNEVSCDWDWYSDSTSDGSRSTGQEDVSGSTESEDSESSEEGCFQEHGACACDLYSEKRYKTSVLANYVPQDKLWDFRSKGVHGLIREWNLKSGLRIEDNPYWMSTSCDGALPFALGEDYDSGKEEDGFGQRNRFGDSMKTVGAHRPLLDSGDRGAYSPVDEYVCSELELALTKGVPYPGDPAGTRADFRGERFYVGRLSDTDYVIMDAEAETENGDIDMVLPGHLVHDPSFNIALWYGEQRAWECRQPWDEGDPCGRYFERGRDLFLEGVSMLLSAVCGVRGSVLSEMRHFDKGWNTHFRVESHSESYVVFSPGHRFGALMPRWVALKARVDVAGWFYHNARGLPTFSSESGLWSVNWGDLDVFSLSEIPMAGRVFCAEGWIDPDVLPEFFKRRLMPERLVCRDRGSSTRLGNGGVLLASAGRGSRVGYERLPHMSVGGVQIPRSMYPAVQRNSSSVKDFSRVVPKPLVVVVTLNGQPARALVDSGSLGDFVSSTVVDQLGIKRVELESPVPLQLAVQGSKSKIICGANISFKYQDISETRYFDIINLSNYDVILGTPWLYQHQACIGFNKSRLVVGSAVSLPMKGDAVAKVASRAMNVLEDSLEAARAELIDYAKPLCLKASDTELPPLRAINHTIPLINVDAIYPWRPSRCPEALRPQWDDKRDSYLKSGRWRITSAGNTVPMLLIPKPGAKGEPPKLRTAVDLRERNKNTYKLSSPLPDIEGILRRCARAKYKSILDGQDAYEQIRIIPEHVARSTVTTPDGNMVSEVIQIGDCNAPATYQALMNYTFSAYIGRFLDVYLDDIVIYSDTLEDHIIHVKLVIDIMRRERLYLSLTKLHFLCKEMKVLGRIIDSEGIRMDPDKVDAVVNWKTPTNRDLLRGFLGSVGYLADDLALVRIPMGVLHGLTGDTVPFRWDYTHERAFEDVKRITSEGRGQHRVPLEYGKGSPEIFMITDGCGTGVAGVVCQGKTWQTAKVAAFYSAKLNPAQQNYPVHEVEMLAGVESMLRHRDILQGTHFKWITDHKGLIHILNQRNLSGRQARWIEKIGEFDFAVEYVPGTENVLADALSRMYSNDGAGTVRARSEYTYYDVVNNDALVTHDISMPLLVGIEASALEVPSAVAKIPARKPRVLKPEVVEARAFAKRMKDKFILKGPVSRTEGVAVDDFASADSDVEAIVPAAPDRNTTKQPPDGLNPLLEVISESLDGFELLKHLKGCYATDIFFKAIVDKPSEFKNFEIDEASGLIFLKQHGRRLLCIPKVYFKGRSAREIVIEEAHSLLAHLGASKTAAYLRDNVWWKDLVSDTKSYCESCKTCSRSKPTNQKPYGLLNPLAVPEKPWESIGIDFVGPLPESKNRDGSFDSITVVIDLLTGMVHLVPSRINYNARQVSELIFEEVYKLHGLPRSIVSDRDVLFTSSFWTNLHKLIGTKLHMSSSYHPQSDGSTERANRTIGQMLRQCVDDNQKNWVAKLPSIEFAINSARSDSTGYAPFFLNTGRMPRSMIWNDAPSGEYPGVANFARQRKLALMSAHDSIIAARVKQTRSANRKRQLAPFKEGELVYVSTKNISFPKGLARKLIPKFMGPYKILKDFNNNSFRIELPSNLNARGVHNVFHAEKLRIHHPNDDRLFPGRLDTQLGTAESDEAEWAVDKILSHSGSKSDAIFEVKWRSGDITWLPYERVSHLTCWPEYLVVMDVSDVESLTEGSGKPPKIPELIVGGVNIEIEALKRTRVSKLKSSSNISHFPTLPTLPPKKSHFIKENLASSIFPTLSLYPNNYHLDYPIMIPKTPLNHLYLRRVNAGCFEMKDPHGPELAIFSAEQVRFFIRHDRVLRTTDGPYLEVPGGYDHFAHLYNSDIDTPHKFARFDSLEDVVITTGAPTTLEAFDVVPERGVKRVLHDGEEVIDAKRAKLMNEMLWSDVARNVKNAEMAKKRRLLKEGGKETREDIEARVHRQVASAQVARDTEFAGNGLTNSVPAMANAETPAAKKSKGKGKAVASGSGSGDAA